MEGGGADPRRAHAAMLERELLSARKIQHGAKSFVRFSEDLEQKKRRLGLVLLALEDEERHSLGSILGNAFNFGPFFGSAKR